MKLKNVFLAIAGFSMLVAACQQGGGDMNKKMETEADTVSYALGISIGTNIRGQFDDVDAALIAKGIQDVYEDQTELDQDEANQFLNEYMQAARQVKMEDNLEKGQAFLEENKEKSDVQVTESGLQYKVLEQGDGPSPAATDKVTVHYEGTLIDGTVFDSSLERGQPATFQVNRVIKGWGEALQMMKVGGKWKLFIPPGLGYGERGAGQKIGPNQVLIFEVELISIGEPEKETP